MGFEVVLGQHALARTLGYSASPEEKAADLAEAFRDPSIAGILCSQGGATANACLPLLGFDAIRQNPKVFLGISDITVLLDAIYARSGLVTFHGDDVIWGLGREVHPFTRQELHVRLVAGAIGPIRSIGPTSTMRPGVAEGPLLGGNLTAFLKLAGTPYLPDVDGAVLFLEEYGFTPEVVYCQLQQLAQINTVLPVGARVRLDATRGEIAIVEPCLRGD